MEGLGGLEHEVQPPSALGDNIVCELPCTGWDEPSRAPDSLARTLHLTPSPGTLKAIFGGVMSQGLELSHSSLHS